MLIFDNSKGSEFDLNFDQIQPKKLLEITKNQNSGPLKWPKMTVLKGPKSPKLISRKNSREVYRDF